MGLRLRKVIFISANRKITFLFGDKPENKLANRKIKLFKSSKAQPDMANNRLYIENEHTRTAHDNQINMVAILKSMDRDKDFVFANWKKKNKGISH